MLIEKAFVAVQPKILPFLTDFLFDFLWRLFYRVNSVNPVKLFN